jgi:Domain of unknown function (DUF3470)
MIAVNAEFSKRWPVITEARRPPSDWRDWEHEPHQYPEHFSPEPGPCDDEHSY